jgi:hypothetical protein
MITVNKIGRQVSFKVPKKDFDELTRLVGLDKTTVDEIVSNAVLSHLRGMTERAGQSFARRMSELLKDNRPTRTEHRLTGQELKVNVQLTADQWFAFELISSELGYDIPGFVPESVSAYVDRK